MINNQATKFLYFNVFGLSTALGLVFIRYLSKVETLPGRGPILRPGKEGGRLLPFRYTLSVRNGEKGFLLLIRPGDEPSRVPVLLLSGLGSTVRRSGVGFEPDRFQQLWIQRFPSRPVLTLWK